MRYLALLRGINVGGKSLIKMPALKEALEAAGFTNVKTYIQSGNVFVDTPEKDHEKVGKHIHAVIQDNFDLSVAVIVFTKAEWQEIFTNAPKWWGKDPDWRHYLLVMMDDGDPNHAITAVGQVNPEIEYIQVGKGVVYQSALIKSITRSRLNKVIGTPIYKQITMRNSTTAHKLLELF